MASRYPSTPTVDYCFHPVRVRKDGVDIVVPCGKCDGCLLHKANEWSMRCGMEIEGSPATIFGSLTYSNKYLPKLYPFFKDDYQPYQYVFGDPKRFDLSLENVGFDFFWSSDHSENIRFNGKEDVFRSDGLEIRPINSGQYLPVQISNWDNFYRPAIAYASKRDIQLWLKLLRRELDEKIKYREQRVLERGYFRYFIISEIGPTTNRPHYHFLIFCQSQEIASCLLEGTLYKNWKMCLQERFDPYVHLCDSGARGYVTQYLTSFSSLPRVYKEAKEVRPFRLASKSPGIGYIEQDKEKIYEDISRRVIKYTRAVARLEFTALLSYPKNFCVTLFPKCYQYSSLSDSRRFSVYSFLYRQVRELGRDYSCVSKRLCQTMHASDYLATRACWKFCEITGETPDYYFYLLDMYYYLVDMETLRSFYKSQEMIDFSKDKDKIFEYYPCIEHLCYEPYLKLHPLMRFALSFCLDSLGFDYRQLIGNKEFFEMVKYRNQQNNLSYRNEVKDICDSMVKMSKYNEIFGSAPTHV